MLEDIEFFSSLAHQEIDEIIQIAHRAEFRRGEYIFRQGDRSRDIYVVETGQVELSIKDLLQEPKVLATLKSGDLFGEMALFDPSVLRSATARSLQNSILIVIPGDKFERLLKEKPSISFKLLGILSKRVKNANMQTLARSEGAKREARIITVASPRNGVGKTTFAVTLAQILGNEKGARTLFVDLDLPFSDGSFALGVHAIRTIVEFCQDSRSGIPDFDTAKKLLSQIKENIWCLAGPVNLIDAEKVDPKALIMGIRQLQKFFDFIILDTDSDVDELLLNAIDLSDQVFFLVDAGSPFSIKSSLRYFYGLSKLNLPADRVTILTAKTQQEIDLKEISNLLKLPVKGQLPFIALQGVSYGSGIYSSRSDNPYCQTIRKLLQDTFPKEFQSNRPAGFFSRLFGGGQSSIDDAAGSSVVAMPKEISGEPMKFRETNFRALLRWIRAGLIAGQYHEARSSIVSLLESTGPTSPLYQTYGELLMQEGNYSEAVDAFCKAVQLDGTNHLALGYSAILTHDRGEFAKAIGILSEKIKNHPTWPDLQRDIGELYLRNSMPEEAIPPLKQALNMNSRYDDARIRLAEAQERLGRHDEALETLQAVKEKNATVLHLMGICLQTGNRFIEALQTFRLLQKLNSSFRDVNARINELQGYFDKLQSLITMHQRIRQEHPSYFDVRIRLAQLLATAGRREEALTECREVLELNPSHQQAQEEIERINRTGKFIIDRSPSPAIVSNRTRTVICNEFLIEVDFGKYGTDVDYHDQLADHILEFSNVRTGKKHEFRFPQILAQKMHLIASSLCPISEHDLIRIRLLDPQEGEILFSDSRVVESVAPITHLRISLETPIKRAFDERARLAQVRHFLIGIDKADDTQPLVAINTRTNLRAEGRSDVGQRDRCLFVFRSTTDEEVVSSGDIVEIRSGGNQERILATFSIGPEDLTAYRRMVKPEKQAIATEI